MICNIAKCEREVAHDDLGICDWHHQWASLRIPAGSTTIVETARLMVETPGMDRAGIRAGRETLRAAKMLGLIAR